MDEENKILNPPSHEEIMNAIKACAMVGGQSKSEIEKTIKNEWLTGHEERIKEAMKFLWSLFNGRERMHRRVIRAGQRENNLSYTKLVKQNFKNNEKERQSKSNELSK